MSTAVRAAVVAKGIALEVVQGELRGGEEYAYLLPGVLSARTYLKQANVRAQALLEKTLEPLALFAWLGGDAHPQGLLDYAWRTLLENHPHDSICGCSVDAVHDENETRFARVLQVAEGLTERALRALANRVAAPREGSIRLLAVNTDVHPYSGLIDAVIDLPVESADPSRRLTPDLFEAPLDFFPRGSSICALTDPDGGPVPFQVLRRETALRQWMSRVDVPLGVHVDRLHIVFAAVLPAAGFLACDAAVGTAEPAVGPAGRVSVEGRSIESDLLRVDVNDDGTLSVLDKRSGRVYGRVAEMESVGDVGDEYNFSPPGLDRRVTSRDARDVTVSIVAAGPLRGVLRVESTLEIPRQATTDRRSRSAETISRPARPGSPGRSRIAGGCVPPPRRQPGLRPSSPRSLSHRRRVRAGVPRRQRFRCDHAPGSKARPSGPPGRAAREHRAVAVVRRCRRRRGGGHGSERGIDGVRGLAPIPIPGRGSHSLSCAA